MEELKRKLLQVVNESNLPLEAIYYLVKDLYRDVDDTYQRYLKDAAAAREAQSQTEEEQAPAANKQEETE